MTRENARNRRAKPIAIQIKNTKHLKEIGVAVLSPQPISNVESTKKWQLLLYAFSDTVALTNLETLFVQLSPTNCYFSCDSDHAGTNFLHRILQKSHVTRRPRHEEATSDVKFASRGDSLREETSVPRKGHGVQFETLTWRLVTRNVQNRTRYGHRNR